MFASYLSHETRTSTTGTAVIVSFMDTDNVIIECSTSEKLWAILGKFVNEENPYCKVKYTSHKKGDKYISKDKTEKEFSRDTLSLDGCTKIPEKIWLSKIDNESVKTQKEDIELLASVAPETLASYLRAIRAGV